MDSEKVTESNKSEACSKTKMKSKVSQSMKHFHEVKDSEKQPKKGDASQQVKFHGRTEAEVGISNFVDSSEGFTGITKHRWGDFIVHEIDLSGNVITLTDTSVPVKQQKAPEDAVKPDWFPKDCWEQLVKLNAAEKSKDSVTIPAGNLSKEQRTQFHETIKTSFPSMVNNTSEVAGEKVITVRKASAAPDKRNTFWKHKPWPKDRPKFLHFCLFKENLDTFVALSNLSMDLKLKSNKFAFAGTKDARAKTTQMISIKQVAAEKIHEASRKFQKMSVGNFTYKDAELKLGDLKGNQFDLVLRHLQGGEEVIARRMDSFQAVGFINYYGMQRFGTTSSATHQVGRAILRREWRAAVDLLLSGREHETGSMADAHRAWRADRDPRRALSCLTGRQQRTTIEGRVLHTLSTVRATAYQEALDRLPSGTRQLYVHAYQSWLWNRLVSRRLAEHGLKLRAGDLVLAGDQPVGAEEPVADEASAAEAQADAPEPEASEGDSDTPSRGGPRVAEVRALTEADLASHTIHDLVMPLPGWAIRYPENDTADGYKELLAEDEITFTQDGCASMPQYSLAGAYRHVLARPGDVSWRVVGYSDSHADLLASDVDKLRGRPPPEDEPNAPFRALVLQFSLPSSSYATMAVREITGTDSSLAAQLRLNDAYSDEIRRLRDQSLQNATAARWGQNGAAANGSKPTQDGKTSVAAETKQEEKPAAGDQGDAKEKDMDTTGSAVREGEADKSTADSANEGSKGDSGAGEPGESGEGAEGEKGQKRSAEDGEAADQKKAKTDEAA